MEFDRTAEDISNVVALEHVNVRVADQGLAITFYVMGMGWTRDPYRFPGTDLMWINLGRSQFHLRTGSPQHWRGAIGVVTPDREALLERLTQVRKELEGTEFAFTERDDHIEVISPWGNVLRAHEPAPEFGPISLGMPYLELDVPVGSSAGIGRFYEEILGTPVAYASDSTGPVATCSFGAHQRLIVRETEREIAAYDGHHVQIYVANFSGPYRKLKERDLITQESSQFQYRFENLIDLDTGKSLYLMQHETRSVTHPFYMRPLVNRNTSETAAIRDEHFDWTLPESEAYEI